MKPADEHAAALAAAIARGAAPGMMPVHRWYLRHDAPWEIAAPGPRDDAALVHTDCSPERYLALYNGAGRDWLWFGVNTLEADAVAARLAEPTREVHVLVVDGEDAGFVEIDHGPADATEMAYVGLLPGHTGRGLGGWMFAAACVRAVARRRLPLTINTCTLDSPGGLALYRRTGFAVQREIDFEDPDPRATGLSPPDVAPHVPRF